MKYINSSVTGFKGRRIPYTIHGKKEDAKELVILLPGANYTVNSPIFHFLGEILFDQSSHILEVNFPYKDEFYDDLSQRDLYEAVVVDAKLVIDKVLESPYHMRTMYLSVNQLEQ